MQPSAPTRAPRRGLFALGAPSLVALAYAALHVAWLLAHKGGARWELYVADGFFLPTFLATGVWAWRTARAFGRVAVRDPGDTEAPQYASAWRLLAAAYFILWVGNVLWAYYDFRSDVPPSAVPPAVRWCTLLSYVPLLAGLLRFPVGRRGRAPRAMLALDLGTVASGTALVIWYVVLRPMTASASWGSLAGLMSFIPPLGDLAVVTTAAALVLQPTRHDRRQWLTVLAAGHLLSVAAGLVAALSALKGGYAPGDGVDALWMISDLLVFVGIDLARRQALARLGGAPTTERGTPAATRWSRAAEADAVTRPSSLAVCLPYVFVAVSFTLLVETAGARWNGPLRVVLAGNGLILLLVGARQLMALWENAQLALATVQQESRFQALVQFASDVVTVLDERGIVTYQSPSVERLTGRQPEEMVGRSLASVLHPDEVGRFERHLHNVRDEVAGARASARPSVWRLRHRDGHWISVETLGTNLVNDPAVRGIVLNTRDVTERTQLEEQLRRAQKMEAVGRLAGGIAHDFNNLLTIVRCNTSAIRDEWTLPGGGRELGEIELAVDRASALTRQLLAFSRRQIVQAVTLNVGTLVHDLAPLLQRLLGPAVALDVVLPAAAGAARGGERAATGVWVVADTGQLEQVVMNLAVNARDAMPGGGRLRITVRPCEVTPAEARDEPGLAPGEYVQLVVSDTGVGMKPEVQAHIFDPFFTTKPAGEGTGLGLSTVFGIVSQGGGHVAVRSAPNSGTTFTVYLRRVAPPAASTPVMPVPALGAVVPATAGAWAPADPTAAPAARGTGLGETLLVVDDEASVRLALQRLLRKHGYEVLVAADGVEALALLERYNGRVDLLLTDMVMPRMGGRELATRFLRLQPRARVVYMSGYTEDDALRDGVRDAESSFVAKPFALTAVVRIIRESLDRATEDSGSRDPTHV